MKTEIVGPFLATMSRRRARSVGRIRPKPGGGGHEITAGKRPFAACGKLTSMSVGPSRGTKRDACELRYVRRVVGQLIVRPIVTAVIRLLGHLAVHSQVGSSGECDVQSRHHWHS